MWITGIRNMALVQEKLKEHFLHARRMGQIERPDGVGIVGNARCGEILTFQIRVEKEVLTEVKFACLGCGAAKAVASYVAELAEGKSLAEVDKIRMEDIFKELEGLPRSKWHCPFQAVDALKMAVEDYRSKDRKGRRKIIEVAPVEGAERCPFCKEILGEVARCETCEYQSVRCNHCGKEVILKKGGK